MPDETKKNVAVSVIKIFLISCLASKKYFCVLAFPLERERKYQYNVTGEESLAIWEILVNIRLCQVPQIHLWVSQMWKYKPNVERKKGMVTQVTDQCVHILGWILSKVGLNMDPLMTALYKMLCMICVGTSPLVWLQKTYWKSPPCLPKEGIFLSSS